MLSKQISYPGSKDDELASGFEEATIPRSGARVAHHQSGISDMLSVAYYYVHAIV